MKTPYRGAAAQEAYLFWGAQNYQFHKHFASRINSLLFNFSTEVFALYESTEETCNLEKYFYSDLLLS